MPPTLLLSVDAVGKGFGARPLFEKLSFGIFEGDRAGLIGPNGSGKSTLLKILVGLEEPDSGIRSLRRGMRVGYVPQDPEFPRDATAEEVVALALALADDPAEEFEKAARVAVILGKTGFEDPSQPVAILSGGWRKRLAIARELVKEPDVLLMDEPTNHLDVEGILWLEDLLQSEPLAYLVVSHDRWFLENVAGRMLELDARYPEGLLQGEGSYTDFLEKRDEILRNQAEYQASLANKVQREVEWLRRGAKARTTKAKGRVQEANRLIAELAELREKTGAAARAGIDFNASDRKTKKLLVAEGLAKSFGDRRIVKGLDLKLTPGARLGLIGPNGSGKTTLLSLLDGTLEPDVGTIQRADWLKTVRFEQNRDTLDRSVSLRRALAPEGDSVLYQGRPVHVASWAKRFLFRSEQLDTPVSRLSGGEQARILIARLMLQPADLLILDEPTNDLDIPTLEVLEESLMEFPGALVLVTHDRFLLESVSTMVLALDGKGNATYFADYTQWEANRTVAPAPAKPAPPKLTTPSKPAAKDPKRLTYKEKQEWEGMEEAILEAEERLSTAQQAVEDPAVATDPKALQERCDALETARKEVERLYARWAELEEKQK